MTAAELQALASPRMVMSTHGMREIRRRCLELVAWPPECVGLTEWERQVLLDRGDQLEARVELLESENATLREEVVQLQKALLESEASHDAG